MPTTIRRAATTAPTSLTAFAVRLEAKAGPCPLGGPELPALAESLTIHATDRRHAYRLAPRFSSLPLRGQVLLVFIDGTLELASA